jgi:hypothetical protein
VLDVPWRRLRALDEEPPIPAPYTDEVFSEKIVEHGAG